MPPNTLTISEDRARLVAFWPDGEIDEFMAVDLRCRARDAFSERWRIEHGAIRPATDLKIESIQYVGRMGVNIVFSDGCARAIYPWGYLREIAAQNAIN